MQRRAPQALVGARLALLLQLTRRERYQANVIKDLRATCPMRHPGLVRRSSAPLTAATGRHGHPKTYPQDTQEILRNPKKS